uniref:Arp2/3 complex 34 kDa subunit n=1 Tax=Panagrellus redivivus TaxID=6233 RepID=A0A7E4VHS1_PANRE
MRFNFDRNEALYNLLTTRFEWFVENSIARPISCDIPLLGGADRVFVSNFADADGKVVQTVIYVSLKSNNFEKLQTYGLRGHLNNIFKGYVHPKNLKGYAFTLQIDLTLLPDDYEELAHRIASIRRELFAPVVGHFFNLQGNFASLPPETPNFDVIEVMANEFAMIAAKPSEVNITFALTFDSTAESTIAKMFLEEFSRETAKNPLFRILAPDAITDKHRLLKSKSNGSNIVYVVVNCRQSRSQNTVRRLALDLMASLAAFIDSEIARIKAKLHQAMRELTSKCTKRMSRAQLEVRADQLPEASFYYEEPKLYNY